ncbi:spermidine/putrescine ABC transporter ATP-binding protein PotA [soil metagenome]
MSHLEVRNLTVRYENQTVLNNVSFDVKENERLCLLGPSGCGKTTSLRVIAGFTIPDEGEAFLDGRAMGSEPPERRNIGILFQNYALFPHLTVYDNVAFGLRMRRLPEADIRRKVGSVLTLVRLEMAAGKRPSQLSGGEQQRIAFARAIVIEPRLLLLDEPFSNLDARLRQEMRGELLDLLQHLNVATVMVTHDQEEAMAIADRIVVMNRGTIEQIGTPTEIYERPGSSFVARFVGASNIFPGIARANGNDTAIDVEDFGKFAVPGPLRKQGTVDVLIRPEKIRVLSKSQSGDGIRDSHQRMNGVLERVQYLGHRTEFSVRAGKHSLAAWSLNEVPASLRPGDAVVIEWPRNGVVVFAREAAG